jgi:hypothetical protein
MNKLLTDTSAAIVRKLMEIYIVFIHVPVSLIIWKQWRKIR